MIFINCGVEVIKKYFPELNPLQYEQLSQMNRLYRYWNAKINVVSRKDVDHLEVHHILHSLSIARIISFKTGTDVLDVGTGGGFPGIPLAILFPDSNFTLIDSIRKKIMVVTEISEALGLSNVFPVHGRAEKVGDKFDFVISRAVTNLPLFTSWVRNNIKSESYNEIKNGIIYLKGGDFQDELNEVHIPARIYNITDFFEEKFFETKKIVYLEVTG